MKSIADYMVETIDTNHRVIVGEQVVAATTTMLADVTNNVGDVALKGAGVVKDLYQGVLGL